MELKLNEMKMAAVLALVAQRDRAMAEANGAIAEMLKVWGAGFENPRFDSRPDGLYIVETEKEGPGDEQTVDTDSQ